MRRSDALMLCRGDVILFGHHHDPRDCDRERSWFAGIVLRVTPRGGIAVGLRSGKEMWVPFHHAHQVLRKVDDDDPALKCRSDYYHFVELMAMSAVARGVMHVDELVSRISWKGLPPRCLIDHVLATSGYVTRDGEVVRETTDDEFAETFRLYWALKPARR